MATNTTPIMKALATLLLVVPTLALSSCANGKCPFGFKKKADCCSSGSACCDKKAADCKTCKH